MQLYIGPTVWLAFGLLGLGLNAYAASDRFRRRLTPDRLTEVQKSYSQPLLGIAPAVLGLWCLFNAVRALIGDAPTWWLWLLAGAAHLGCLASRSLVGHRLNAAEAPRPDAPTQQRHRRAVALAVPAALCVWAASPVADFAEHNENTPALVAAVALLVVALVGFVAAGWAAVWVTGDQARVKNDSGH